MLKQKKAEALKNYKEARENYLNTGSSESWKNFCDAKRTCMLLGVRI